MTTVDCDISGVRIPLIWVRLNGLKGEKQEEEDEVQEGEEEPGGGARGARDC